MNPESASIESQEGVKTEPIDKTDHGIAPIEEANSRRWVLVFLAAALMFTGLCLHAAWLETPTVDEFAHVPAGCFYLKFADFELGSRSPPLMRCILALPAISLRDTIVPERTPSSRTAWEVWTYGDQFMRVNATNYFRIFFYSRIPAILAGLLTALLLFRWASSLFGRRAGALTATLFCLNPTVIAHSHIATVDSGCMLTMLIATLTLRWACARPSWARFTITGVALGVALLVKFTAVLLIPLFFFLIVFSRIHARLRAVGEMALILIGACLVVNIGMGFDGSFKRIGEFKFVSSFGKTLANLPAWVPVPLPEHFLSGFDLQAYDAEKGEFENYLFGEWSSKGYWSYNVVSLLVKNPIPLVFLALVSPWFIVRARIHRKEKLFIILPLLSLLLVFSAFSQLSIGIRYLLPIYPFLYMLVAAVWARSARLRGWATSGAVVILSLASALWIHPDYLMYFNLLAGGSGNGHRILLDSNLDWGQDLYRLKPALDRLGCEQKIKLLYFGHVDPGLYGIRHEPIPAYPVDGVVATSVNFLLGFRYPIMDVYGRLTLIERERLAWLRSLEPTVKLGSIWVFDLRRSATTELRSGKME